MDLWKLINKSLDVDDKIADHWWTIIVDKYSESQRHYHTTNHIEDMLRLCEEHKGKLKNIKAVVYAIVFHDIIYNPKAPDNEEKSAEFFKNCADEAGLKNDLVESVIHWILEAKKHSTPEHLAMNPTAISDLHYVLDFDMAVLGWPKSDYERYAEQIRQEYIHIPDKDFKSKRAQVLKIFLTTPYIYATPEFREKFEGPARENIRREISGLTEDKQ